MKKPMLIVALIALVPSMLAPAAPHADRRLPATDAAGPDLILHDAVVLSMDPAFPAASAVAIEGELIVAVGSDPDVLAIARPDTTLVDLDGLTLTPGFIDSHGHWIDARDQYGVDTPDEAIQRALEGGWTSLSELFVNRGNLAELRRLSRGGDLRARVNAYLVVNFAGDRFGFWFKRLTPGQRFGQRLRLGGAKIFVDGCGLTTMYLSQPNRIDGELGDAYWERPGLRDIVARLHEAGWPIAAHACGDAAVDLILDALRFALDGDRTARPRIEHAIVVRDDQLRLMRRLGVSPSIQLTFCDSTDAPKGMRRMLGRYRLGWTCRYRDFVEEPRLHTIGSTDAPNGPGTYRPKGTTSVMQALVEGTTRFGRPGKEPPRWLRVQRLTLDQALQLLTTAGARAIFAEDELGAIAPGMLADLVVLAEDPHTVPLERLGRIDVAMVFVGGSIEVCAPGYEDLCPALPFVSVGSLRVRASRSIGSNPVSSALDGDDSTWWSSGAGPTQWLEIDLRHEASLRAVDLVVAQDLAGPTTHLVWGKAGEPEDEYVLFHTFSGVTNDLDVLHLGLDPAIPGIRYLLIETQQDPSPVAWREIVIDAC